MKLDSLPLVVVDTCLYIHLLTNQNPSLAERTQGVLDDNNQNHRVLLPAIVRAEAVGVARSHALGKRDTPTKRRKAAEVAIEFFESQDFVFAELDERLIEIAEKLIPEYGLRGADASILATAIAHDAQFLYTQDRQLLKVKDKIPNLRVQEPPEPNHLVFE